MKKPKKMQGRTDSPPTILNLGNGHVCIVDSDQLPALSKFKWRAVQARRNWYAKATFTSGNKRITISMHRFLARTRYPFVCHHRNSNSLDNRLANLKNMSKDDHSAFHHLNSIMVKFKSPQIDQDASNKTFSTTAPPEIEEICR